MTGCVLESNLLLFRSFLRQVPEAVRLTQADLARDSREFEPALVCQLVPMPLGAVVR